MSGSEFATREDLNVLRADLRDTERLLRDRDDEKERGLRLEFVAAVQASEDRTHSRLDQIDEHLNQQDELITAHREIWPSFWRTLVLFASATILAALILHFGFHIG